MSKLKEPIQGTIKTIRVQFPDSEALFTHAFEIMRNKAEDRCTCGALISKYYKRLPMQHYKYICSRCRLVVSVFSATPLRCSHKDMVQTLELAGYFFHKGKVLKPMEIVKYFNCRYKTAQNYNRRIIEWITLAEASPGENMHKDGKRLCRSFASKYNNISEVIQALMNALPPLTLAMQRNKTNK